MLSMTIENGIILKLKNNENTVIKELDKRGINWRRAVINGVNNYEIITSSGKTNISIRNGEIQKIINRDSRYNRIINIKDLDKSDIYVSVIEGMNKVYTGVRGVYMSSMDIEKAISEFRIEVTIGDYYRVKTNTDNCDNMYIEYVEVIGANNE